MNSVCMNGSLEVDVELIEDGYAWLRIYWRNSWGHPEELTVNIEGWCSRDMPIRSGQGPPEIQIVGHDKMLLKFTPELARRVELPEEILFVFDATEELLSDLQRFLDPEA